MTRELEKNSRKVTKSDEVAQVRHHLRQWRRLDRKIIAEAMQKVGNEGVITVEEAKSLETELDVVEGMQFDGLPLALFRHQHRQDGG